MNPSRVRRENTCFLLVFWRFLSKNTPFQPKKLTQKPKNKFLTDNWSCPPADSCFSIAFTLRRCFSYFLGDSFFSGLIFKIVFFFLWFSGKFHGEPVMGSRKTLNWFSPRVFYIQKEMNCSCKKVCCKCQKETELFFVHYITNVVKPPTFVVNQYTCCMYNKYCCNCLPKKSLL